MAPREDDNERAGAEACALEGAPLHCAPAARGTRARIFRNRCAFALLSD